MVKELNKTSVWLIVICLVLFLLLGRFVGLKVKYKAKYEQYVEYSDYLQENIAEEKRLHKMTREYAEHLKEKLDELNAEVEEFKMIEERLRQGVDQSEAYKLLQKREAVAKPIVLDFLGLRSPSIPKNDDELWERGRKIYGWLSDNYAYQGDKSVQFGPSMVSMQFFSPDELLADDNARGGDCDDYAMLFAGLMLASGVPSGNVRVVAGPVDGDGWHAWNEVRLSSGWVRVDPVCSQELEIIGFMGLSWGVSGARYPKSPSAVECFGKYDSRVRFNDEAYSKY